MEITEVKVFPVRDKKLRAFASIVFEGSFMVNDIKIIQGKDGYFISMPSRRRKNGRFKDIAHPLNQETRQAIEERIIAEYRRVSEGGEPARPEAKTAAAAEVPPAAVAAQSPRQEPTPTAEPTREADPPGEPDDPRQRERDEAEEKSLDEVAEHHLSDSYWTT